MCPGVAALTDDEVPGGGEHQGAGERDAVQAEASRRRPQAAVVQQPNEAAAQAEVDGPAVGDDAVVTLRRQRRRVSESVDTGHPRTPGIMFHSDDISTVKTKNKQKNVHIFYTTSQMEAFISDKITLDVCHRYKLGMH